MPCFGNTGIMFHNNLIIIIIQPSIMSIMCKLLCEKQKDFHSRDLSENPVYNIFDKVAKSRQYIPVDQTIVPI